MTEQDIAETLTIDRLFKGMDIAEEEVFYEYDSVFSEWDSNPTSSDVTVERVNSLETALVSLRVAQSVLEMVELDDEEIQEIATNVTSEDASIESMADTAESVQELLQ